MKRKKYPNIQLLVLAGLVIIVGYFLTKAFSTVLLVAGALVVLAVIGGLMRRPSRVFGPYRWPGYTPTIDLLQMVGVAVAVLVVGLLISNQPVTCGGQEMRPDDECVDLGGGGSASYQDVANAPITQFWIYLVIAAALVITAIVKLIRRRPPTTEEVAAFEAEVAAIRERLVNLVNGHLPYLQMADGQQWFREMLAQFEQDVEQERQRAGIT